jgi:hypothetical protein
VNLIGLTIILGAPGESFVLSRGVTVQHVADAGHSRWGSHTWWPIGDSRATDPASAPAPPAPDI